MGEKSYDLKTLKKSFDEKIGNATYASLIRAECYYNINGKENFANRSNSVLYLSKNKEPINCAILANDINSSNYKFSIGLKKIYPQLIEATSNISINKKVYAKTINDTLGKILGGTEEISNSNGDYVTTINYKKKNVIFGILNDLKEKLNQIDVKTKKSNIENEIKSPTIFLKVDQEGYWDSFGAAASSRRDYHQLSNKQQEMEFSGFFNGSKVIFPGKSDFLEYVSSYKEEYVVYDSNKLINKQLQDILENILPKVGEIVKDALNQIEEIKQDIEKIYEKYEELEKKEIKKYKENLNKSIINKDKNKIQKYIDKLKNKNVSKKKIKKLVKKYADDAKLIVTFKANSLSILTIKNKNKKSSQADNQDDINPVIATGAEVVATKSKKKKSKDKNKNDKKSNSTKNTKSKKLKNKIASATAIAISNKEMKKISATVDEIRKGATNEIEQEGINYTNNVSKINNDRDVAIANAEAARDNEISELYQEATEKINSIDASDSNASEQIANIKQELEEKINAVKENASTKIEEIKNEAIKKVETAKNEYETKVNDIKTSSEKEIAKIQNEGLDAKTELTDKLTDSASKEPTNEDIDSSPLDDANNNKTEAETNLSDSQSSYASTLTEKEQEIASSSNSGSTENDNTNQEPSNPNVDNPPQENDQPNTSTEENKQPNNTETGQSYPQNSNSSSNSNSNVNSNNTNNNANTYSSNNDTETVETSSEDIVETPAVPDDEDSDSIIPSNPNDEEEMDYSDDSASEITEPTKSKSGPNIAIPIGLGIGAAGAATVAGIRYAKNRKQTEDIDESYDDEDNNTDDYTSEEDDSEYMKDDYLGPAGSMYTETDLPEDSEQSDIPDDTVYNNVDHLEEELDDDTFPDDEVLNGLE